MFATPQFLWVRNTKVASLRASTSRSPVRLLSGYWAWLQLSEGLADAGRSIPKMTYSHAGCVSVGFGQEVSALCHVACLQGCSRSGVPKTQRLAYPEQDGQGKERKSQCFLWLSLGIQAPTFLPYFIHYKWITKSSQKSSRGELGSAFQREKY